MRRYWINANDIHEDRVTFSDEVFHHIFEVCRQDIGNHFEVLTEHSKAYLVEVTERGKKKATGKIIEARSLSPIKKPFIHLALSIPKFSTFENVIEKSVELGVSSIIPLISDYSFIKNFSDKEWLHKKDRWQKIVISATQQSGRGNLLKIEPPTKLLEFSQKMNQNSNSLCLLLYEGDSQNDIKRYAARAKANTQQPIENIYLIIGSEGGFSTQEVNSLKHQGLSPVTMGDQVLRVETACIAAISVLKYEFSLMGEF